MTSNDTHVVLWDELLPNHHAMIAQHYPDIAYWRTVARARSSSVAVMIAADTPVALVAISHDRVNVSGAIVDVAVVRATHVVKPYTHMHIVDTLMHQALSLLAEGIGVILVHGDVATWAPYGFAPTTYRATIAQHDAPPLAVPRTATYVDIDEATWRDIQSMALRSAKHDVFCIDTAMLPSRPWVLLHGRDGQLRAAADILQRGDAYTVVRAVACDDGAASDLVQQLWYTDVLRQQPTLALSAQHAGTRAALAHYGVLQLQAAGAHTLLAGVIDLPTMLNALVPAFEARVRSSEYADWCGGVRIEISDERAMIVLDRGRVHIIDGTREAAVRIKQVDVAALAQLVFGYRSVSLLRRAGLLHCDDTELPLCEVLFPYCAPVLSLA